MTIIKRNLLFLTTISCLASLPCTLCNNSYEIPTPTLEILTPKGFRVSIPDEPGIELFAFHGAINREIRGAQPGDFEGETRNAVKGRWYYENTNEFLVPGDTLYYWVHVQHRRIAYRLNDKSFTITDIQTSGATTTTTKNDRHVVTEPTVHVRPRPEPNRRQCEPSKTKVRERQVCKGELIFEDHFNDLNWTRWEKEIGIPLDSNDADFVSFQNRPENCYVKSGHLHIVPNLLTEVPGFSDAEIRSGFLDFGTDCTGLIDIERECKRAAGLFRILPPVVSAKIRTKKFFSFLYGRVEVRAKLTRGDWLFPQIFLEPYTYEYGVTGFASGQMRVAFIRGNENLDSKEGHQIDGRRLYGGAVLTTGEAYRDIWLKSSVRREHLGQEFHTYSLTWTDESIALSVDDNEYGFIRGGFSGTYRTHNISHAAMWESGGYMAPFDQEFYLALGVSAGGISDFPDDCRNGDARLLKPWSNTSPKAELKFWNDRSNWITTWNGEEAGMEIDYIKVWAL